MPRRGRVRFAQAAKRDLDEIWQYVRDDNGSGRADAVLGRRLSACRELENAPLLGRPMPALGPGMRMLAVGLYRLPYRTDGSRVLIARVVHARRDFRKAWRERAGTPRG